MTHPQEGPATANQPGLENVLHCEGYTVGTVHPSNAHCPELACDGCGALPVESTPSDRWHLRVRSGLIVACQRCADRLARVLS